MKLGSETGNLINHIMSREVVVNEDGAVIEPVKGMGATVLCWSDRFAATVIEWDGKILTLQQDIATRKDLNGMSDSQCYEYTPDEKGIIYFFRKNKRGTWEEVIFNSITRRWNKGGLGLKLGERDQFYDYSF